MGSGLVETILFDQIGTAFPGDGLGTPASFTANATGFYSFTVKCLLLVTSNIPSNTYRMELLINGTVTFSYLVVAPSSINDIEETSFTALTQLTNGDVVTWQLSYSNLVSGIIGGFNPPSSPFYRSWVSGTFLST